MFTVRVPKWYNKLFKDGISPDKFSIRLFDIVNIFRSFVLGNPDSIILCSMSAILQTTYESNG